MPLKKMSGVKSWLMLCEMNCFTGCKHCRFLIIRFAYVHDNGRLPVVNFAAGGVATPADAALMMQLGAEGVFVGSVSSVKSRKRAAAIVSCY